MGCSSEDRGSISGNNKNILSFALIADEQRGLHTVIFDEQWGITSHIKWLGSEPSNLPSSGVEVIYNKR
jgi:hypothetical protein